MKEEKETKTIYDEDVDYITKDKLQSIEKKYKNEENDTIINSIVNKLKNNVENIKSILYETPAFINLIKSSIPKESFQAIFSNDELNKIKDGTLELMTSKKNELYAILKNPKNGKIVSHVNLEKILITPEITSAIANYTTQAQLADIAKDIKYIETAVEDVLKGQENDRLAIAYSSKQKLLQATSIKDENLKKIALLNLASSAEDNKNQLMLSQIENIEYIKNQPKDFFRKMIKDNEKKKDEKINLLRENLNALNMVSLIEALAYQELGEPDAAILSLQHYGDYINKFYLKEPGFVQRLDNIDPSPKQYWSQKLPKIEEKIKELANKNIKLIEEKK